MDLRRRRSFAFHILFEVCKSYKIVFLFYVGLKSLKSTVKVTFLFGLILFSAVDFSKVYAQSFVINRDNKTDRLPKHLWGAPQSQERNKRALPPSKGTASHIQTVIRNTQRKQQRAEKNLDTALPLIKDASRKVALKQFYKALQALQDGRRQRPVTVLHLGNDRIARDRFSGDLRELMQQRFGNAGRGMTMPGQIFPFFRARDVRFKQEGVWRIRTVTDPQSHHGFGITGASLSSSDPEARLVLESAHTDPFSWVEVAFLAGPKKGTAVLSMEKNGQILKDQVLTTATKPSIKRIRISGQARALTLQPLGDQEVTVLSWRTGADTQGLKYINLGLPQSGLYNLEVLDAHFVKSDLEVLKPDLIVLSYGTVEALRYPFDSAAYEMRAHDILRILQTLAPQASLIVTGPPDMSHIPHFGGRTVSAKPCVALNAYERQNYRHLLSRRDQRLARWYPPVSLRYVRHALRSAAARTKAYFWDWSSVMGGACGIHAWVHARPKLAVDDHIRLTDEGARRSAEAFYTDIMTGFESFRLIASR